ncbi:1-deoxy-D-xylulose 5-phosphate reductoisomerase [bacterium BMS3Abin01]|nr:1-deoxy-D-xylulose 5-phosphate reductoisomerase [bacterium BMS3Abin01]
MKRVLILGSTGSVGVQALEVISESPGLEAVGLAAGSRHGPLIEQAGVFDVTDVAIIDERSGGKVAAALPACRVFTGPDSIRGLIEAVDCDLVLNAIVGAAGLEATIATLEKGVDLALANKESLVVGGELVMRMAAEAGARLLPVDSEHSAVFQCLQGSRPARAERIFLTASGGPFLGMGRDRLENVSRDDALKHPRWEMGSKITIDSATLMNKGLEIIEAHYLFETAYEDIEVVIHPQSIVHSMVRFADGSVLAQMGLPSMKLPIAYALNYPERRPVSMPQLDLPAAGELTFLRPDIEAFPCLRLAREAGERGGGAPIALNAANEIAVDAFLAGSIAFLDIARVVAGTLLEMDAWLPSTLSGLEQIQEIDTEARRRAGILIS